MKYPNILFLMSDEHRPDVTGYEGNEVVRTPVLDRLAQEGVVFENCYTPSPICMPARQAIMSGQHCKTCRCRAYGDDLPPFSNTFSNWLATYGYQTVVSGKLHHTGRDQMQGWTNRIAGDISVSGSYIAKKEQAYVSQPKFKKWSDTKEVMRAGIDDTPNGDEFAVDGAIRFIHKYFENSEYDRVNDNPLLLKVSLVNPHYPYQTKTDLFKYYMNRVHPYVEEPISEHPFLSRRQIKMDQDVTEREIRRATAAYYGMVEEIDTQYGRVLKALEDVGENLDDWLIIYTSDHGEMLGQHGIWEKQKFYEASVRVPLILHAPKRFDHKVVHENVNTIDLYATLCDYIGIKAPDNLDSRSLLDLCQRDSSNWDNVTISHYGYGSEDNNYLMIKKDDLKYQYYGKDMPEVLFDLSKNPEETIDFINHPDYKQQVEKFRVLKDIYIY